MINKSRYQLVVLTVLLLQIANRAVIAPPVPSPPTANELLTAPLIAFGEVREYFDASHHPSSDKSGNVLTDDGCAAIRIRRVIRGKLSEEAFVRGVENAEVVGISFEHQVLERGRSYVLFLKPDDRPRHLLGQFESMCALETEAMPPDDSINTETPEQMLRLIAKANVSVLKERIAATWCEFLGGMFDDADKPFFLEKMADKRPTVRGFSLLALCRNCPIDESLYSKTMGFLKESKSLRLETWAQVPRDLSQCLKERMNPKDLTVSRLREWMTVDVEYLQEMAVVAVRERGELSAIKDVVGLLERSQNVEIQYDCIQTILVLEKRSGPSYREYMKNPRKYLMEEVERHKSGR